MRLKISLMCAVLVLFYTASARTRPHIVVIETSAGLVSDSAAAALLPDGYRFVYAYGAAGGVLDGIGDALSSDGYRAAGSSADMGPGPLFMMIRTDAIETLCDTVSALRRDGLYDDALVVLTSSGGDTPYHDSWHIPMIVKLPASMRSTLPRGSLVAAPVTTADVVPTVMQAAGVERNGAPGESMLPLIRRKAKAWRHYVCFVSDEYIAVTDGRFKYIRHRDGGGEELYNLLVDSSETENIAGRRSILLDTMRKAADACH